jgi:hypothetical protein
VSIFSRVWWWISAFWRTVLVVGALLGILYLPQDIDELPKALQKWGPVMGVFTREIALLTFAIACAAWVIWIDIRPFARQHWAQWRGENAVADERTIVFDGFYPTTTTNVSGHVDGYFLHLRVRNKSGQLLERCLVKVERVRSPNGDNELQSALTTKARYEANKPGRFFLGNDEKKLVCLRPAMLLIQDFLAHTKL